MEITLHLMPVEEKALLVRLMELYNYEFSAFSGDDISEYGCYGYDHIDDYWNEEGRFPYLIRVDGKIAGFALICPIAITGRKRMPGALVSFSSC